MKIKINNIPVFIILLSLTIYSCEDILEIDPPQNKLTKTQVFERDETAISAMQGIYNQLYSNAFSEGFWSSITFLSGLSGDIVEPISMNNLDRLEFQQHEINPDNPLNYELWSSAYNMVYNANAFLEGLTQSTKVSEDLKMQLEGEARFIRAFTYFYLTNLYGEVPLILTTDYNSNQLASSNSQDEINNQILEDLNMALELLNDEYRVGERTSINKHAAAALIARVNLYNENWSQAEVSSSEVIEQTSLYEILPDFNSVFLPNSREAIWQISPLGGGSVVTHTNEGNLFIIEPGFLSFFANAKLDLNFVENFEEFDKRLINWVGYNSDRDAFFPYKYKVPYSTTIPPPEYSMVLRLVEQYFIRAEARAMMGDLNGAIQDLNIIRERAGLELIPEDDSTLTQPNLREMILEERKRELFSEWGHRWLDLKRAQKADEIFENNGEFWDETDVLYPIPSEDRKKNPNLPQNPGY